MHMRKSYDVVARKKKSFVRGLDMRDVDNTRTPEVNQREKLTILLEAG